MNELQIFENEEFGEIRTMMIDGEPWFVGKDVAEALEYKNPQDALGSHVDEEDKQIFQKSENATFEIPNRGLLIINESGLYSLIMSSKLPSAKRFKRWVTHEVLPAIRKTGSYHMKPKPTRPITTDDYMQAARIVSRCCSGRVPMVLDLLEKAGLEIPKIEEQQRYDGIPASVVKFLEDTGKDDILNVASAQVYEDYVKKCEESGADATSKIAFSKYVNRVLGTGTKVTHRDGAVIRVFFEIGG